MSTAWEKEKERRQEKLDEIAQQVKDGTLKIRKMTAKERAANPPRPRPEGGRGRKRR